jgi:hypothetical protein
MSLIGWTGCIISLLVYFFVKDPKVPTLKRDIEYWNEPMGTVIEHEVLV